MTLRKLFKKWKVKLSSFLLVSLLTILEVILILWCNNWAFSPAIVPIFVQYIMIFEHRDIWKRMTKKEKEEVMLSEDDVGNLIIGIEKLLKEGKTGKEILDEIKEGT